MNTNMMTGNKMDFDTEFKSTYIIDFVDADNTVIFQALWGIVLLDKKMRFPEDHYVFTSNIEMFINDELVQTRNTIYKINTETTDNISLPLKLGVIDALASGISPSELMHYLSDKKMH